MNGWEWIGLGAVKERQVGGVRKRTVAGALGIGGIGHGVGTVGTALELARRGLAGGRGEDGTGEDGTGADGQDAARQAWRATDRSLERIGPTWFDRMRHGRVDRSGKDTARTGLDRQARQGSERTGVGMERNGLDWLAGMDWPGCVAEGIGTKRLGQAARDWQEGTDRTRQGLG